MTASADSAPRRFPSAAQGASPWGVRVRAGLSILVMLTGAADLLIEASPAAHPAVRMCVDLAFGLALWTLVVLRFYRAMNRSAAVQPSEVRAVARRLSRTVYMLLYVLVFARQAIYALGPAWRGGGIPRAFLGQPQIFPPFLLYGLAALVLINGAAAWWNHNASKIPRDAL